MDKTEKAPERLDARRRAILARAVEAAPFDGWTDAMLAAAAEEAGCAKGDAALAFPKGVSDLLDFYADEADGKMLAALGALPLGEMRIREKVAAAVRARIEALAGEKEAARRAAATLTLPHLAPLGARLAWRTADRIWRAIGDASTDFNFYTKRAILTGVYGSTLAVWFNDDGEGSEKTWAFLDARIENVMQFEKFKAKVKKSPLADLNPVRILSKFRYGAGQG
ncbi:MAG: COQ9 family protein [Parvularculaceae bacterium]